MNQTKSFPVVVTLIFFLSGCAALIFETLWFRSAGYVLGSSVWSAAAVLTAFMAGLGIGNALLAFAGHHLRRPFLAYIIIELAIGGFGLASVVGLPSLAPWISSAVEGYTDQPAFLNLWRFLVAFGVLVIPAVAMGATLPVLQKALHHYDNSFSASVGRLYGWNTLGAVAGVLVAEFFLIHFLGLTFGACVAAAINLLVAVIVWIAFGNAEQMEAEQPPERLRAPIPKMALLLLAPFLAGFILLALEVVWFRYIILSQVGTSVVFAVMLAIVLVGIALGGLIIARWQPSLDTARRWLVYLPALSLLSVAVGYAIFEYVSVHIPQLIYSNQYLFIVPALVLMLPASIISGMLFPLYGALLFDLAKINTRATGLLTLANTFGAALGSALATFFLLPRFGIETSLFMLACGYLALIVLAYCFAGPTSQANKLNAARRYGLPVVAAVVAVALFPFGTLEASYSKVGKWRYPGEQLTYSREELNATLQYFQSDYLGEPISHRLVTNSYSMSSTDFFSKRYMNLFVYLPYMLHPKIEKVLQISYGVGNTAEAVVSLDSMKQFDVVDISADILELSSLIHSTTGVFPLQDKRTTAHVEDGRFYLQTREETYDLITGEPPPPKNAGVANLYTEEYFSLIRKRLNSGGIATYWLPVHNLYPSDAQAIIKAFCNVFEDCSLWNGAALDWILMGSRDGYQPSLNPTLAFMENSPVRHLLQELAIEDFAHIAALYMADAEDLGALTKNVPPVTDNFPHRIDPDFKDVFTHATFYDQLLDIDRRKKSFSRSQFVSSLFDGRTARQAYNAFDDNAKISSTRINGLGYLQAYAINTWPLLADTVAREKSESLRLLALGLDPFKEKIITTKLQAAKSEQAQTVELNTEAAKLLIARGQFAEAKALLEKVKSGDSALDPDLLHLYYFTSALLNHGVSSSMEAAMKADDLKPAFRSWLAAYRFPATLPSVSSL